MDDRVTAHVFLELAKANDRLAHLEAREKEVPVLSGTSNARLVLSRRVNNARSLASGWARVYALLEMEATAEARDVTPVQPAPERTVAWCEGCRHPEHAADVCTMPVNVDTDHEQMCGCEA